MRKRHAPTASRLALRGLLLAAACLAWSPASRGQPGLEPADAVYVGGDILTMAGPEPEYVEALAVADGRIVFAGPMAEAQRLVRPFRTRVVDLDGRTLLPGFIDTHGHFLYFGRNLLDANLVGCGDIADLQGRLKAHAGHVPADGWLVGFGYQARNLREGRPPTIEELDAVSADRPVLVVDSSGHLGAANAAAFAAAGITPATPDPDGGRFARKADGSSLAGPVEETALNAVRVRRPPLSRDLATRVITGAADTWARHGQTTAMEAGLGLGRDDVAILQAAIHGNVIGSVLPIDLFVAVSDAVVDDVLAAGLRIEHPAPGGSSDQVFSLRNHRPDGDNRYLNRVRIGGIKFWLDGNLETAWFTEPYATNPPGRGDRYTGHRQVPDELLDAAFDRFWASDLQIHMHMNGDAAADQALAAIDKAVGRHGPRDHRPVFVHASWLRPDQIERMKSAGAIPTFLAAGIVPGGDAVVKLWGLERATHAMACRSFLRLGLPFTLSHDAPVSPTPSVLALVDAAVNRATPGGTVIGPDERIPPYAALRAVTALAAYQLKEEKTKGTLEPGKLADLVILEQNPLKVDPAAIKDIKVDQTIKEGRVVYRQ